MEKLDLDKILKSQKDFSSKFFDSDSLSLLGKETMLKTLCLALHHEVSQIVSSTNFKFFKNKDEQVKTDVSNILYNSIDSLRYIFAILNLYDVRANEIYQAYEEVDNYLNNFTTFNPRQKDQKVIVVDIDDVICEFRETFNNWLREKHNVLIDENSTSYYSSKEVKDHGLSPEGVFEEFIESDMLLSIPPIKNMVEFLRQARLQGYYIQLLTSRPEDNPRCKYQTCKWLVDNNIEFDSVGFAPEKYIWLAKQEYYISGDVYFAIDDSPKHSLEYATHDIDVFTPRLPYNTDIFHQKITHFDKNNIKTLEKTLD